MCNICVAQDKSLYVNIFKVSIHVTSTRCSDTVNNNGIPCHPLRCSYTCAKKTRSRQPVSWLLRPGSGDPNSGRKFPKNSQRSAFVGTVTDQHVGGLGLTHSLTSSYIPSVFILPAYFVASRTLALDPVVSSCLMLVIYLLQVPCPLLIVLVLLPWRTHAALSIICTVLITVITLVWSTG